jgi:hypothetical protein
MFLTLNPRIDIVEIEPQGAAYFNKRDISLTNHLIDVQVRRTDIFGDFLGIH